MQMNSEQKIEEEDAYSEYYSGWNNYDKIYQQMRSLTRLKFYFHKKL